MVWAQPSLGMVPIPLRLAELIFQKAAISKDDALAIGWGVHFFVSYLYAYTYCLLADIFLKALPRITLPVLMAVALGMAWFATWISGPAVLVVVSLIARRGLPPDIPPPYFAFDNRWLLHGGFFLLCFFISLWGVEKERKA